MRATPRDKDAIQATADSLPVTIYWTPLTTSPYRFMRDNPDWKERIGESSIKQFTDPSNLYKLFKIKRGVRHTVNHLKKLQKIYRAAKTKKEGADKIAAYVYKIQQANQVQN